MKFIREIPRKNLSQPQINNLEQFGFTLVYTAEDTIEVWVEEAAA